MGIIHGLTKKYPQKKFYLLTRLDLPEHEKITLQDVLHSLKIYSLSLPYLNQSVPRPIKPSIECCKLVPKGLPS